MLGQYMAYPTIAVKDIEAGKQFYGGTLGLEMVSENEGGVMYKAGDGGIFVYPSQTAGTNQATYLGWTVEDVEAEVENLKSKGVTFEHYDNMGPMKLEGDLHVMGDMKAAWFKDPDGNILSLTNEMP